MRIFALLAVGALLLGCTQDTNTEPSGVTPDPAPVEDPVDDGGGESADDEVDEGNDLDYDEDGAVRAADAANLVGFALHRELTEQGENTVTSPTSAAMFLAMVAVATEGETQQEILDALGIEEVDQSFLDLQRSLLQAEGADINLANAIWTSSSIPVREEFIDEVATLLDASATEVNMGSPEVIDIIDGWAAEQTDDMVTEVAEAIGLPNSDMVAVIANALAFVGEWSEAFDPDLTAAGEFTTSDGTTVEVPMMSATERTVPFLRGDDFSAVRLTYGEDERFGMEVFLPDEDVDFDAFVSDFDVAAWEGAAESFAPQEVDVRLPSFEVEWESSLLDAMAALGMEKVLGTGAEFGPLTGVDAWLDAVVQATYVEVTEEGTRAAAVTIGGVTTESVRQVYVFEVDRPFVFTISDAETGAVLMLGSIENPTA